MGGVGFKDRRNVGRVIIEGGEPFLFLFLGPLILGRCDVIIGLGRALLERAGRVHRCKRRGAQILWGLFDLRPNRRRAADQMMAHDILPNFIQTLGYIRNEFVWGGILVLVFFDFF